MEQERLYDRARGWFTCYHEWQPSKAKMLANSEWVDSAVCMLCGTVYVVGYEAWQVRYQTVFNLTGLVE